MATDTLIILASALLMALAIAAKTWLIIDARRRHGSPDGQPPPPPPEPPAPPAPDFSAIERVLREETRQLREEQIRRDDDLRGEREKQAAVARAETSSALSLAGENQTRAMARMAEEIRQAAQAQERRFEAFRLETETARAGQALELAQAREGQTQAMSGLAEELRQAALAQERRLEAFRLETETARAGQAAELAQALETAEKRMSDMRSVLDANLRAMMEGQQERMERMRRSVEEKVAGLAGDTRQRLDDMRRVVDQELRESVEKRFNESFKDISERLAQVHQGLGEMQQLAAGVGDLKRTLAGVKTRGLMGEVQLAALLGQMLDPSQYETNHQPGGEGGERVEFAVRLPGQSGDTPVFLPIDSKFPMEDYQRLLDAYDAGAGAEAVDALRKSFTAAVRKCAKDIHDKYIRPPHTTDFAVMFVPYEGLYAEIIRQPGVFEALIRDFKISVAGPANLAAFLNSLQMGFQTLAIQKRTGEAWNVLKEVKREFAKYADWVDKTHKKLSAALDELGLAGTRTRMLERKLKAVGETPHDSANNPPELLTEALPESLPESLPELPPELPPGAPADATADMDGYPEDSG